MRTTMPPVSFVDLADPRSRSRRRQGGFSMVELAVVLAIIGGLIAMTLMLQPRIEAWLNDREAVAQLNYIDSGMNNFFGRNANYNGLTDAWLEAHNIIPPSALTGTAGVWLNPWKGTITIAENGSNYTVTYDGVPDDSCIHMARYENVTSLTINGGSAIDPVTATPITLASECNAVAGGGAGNTMVFTFN